MINNANASVNISSSAFFSELMKISTDIIWKNQMLANRYENIEDYINTELFTSAIKNIITFDSVYQFDYNVLISAGLSEEQALAGMDLKETIPEQYRNNCVQKYISYILQKNNNTGRYINYTESNNYYRMLFGLPDIGDTDFFYNTIYDDISKDIPIHELSIHERYMLETYGFLSELIEQNPDKKYLKYLTNKCIDPAISRNTDRFGILWINGSDFTNLLLDFKAVYEDCRININRVYYTEAFKRDSEMYEGFMAMCILFMTIQLMHQKYLDSDLTRDFYDLDSIKYIYSNYSVPYYSNIPLSYHIKIVKNLNSLLSYKGSNRIFFDLFELFNYGSIDIYNYYLLKTHKFDESGNPVFVKNIDESYDYPSMYDIKFAKVDITKNPQVEISNPINHVDFDLITGLDPYWISDSELMSKLYSTKFNYLESKYIGLQVVFDLTKIIYESSYFFKMILDNRLPLSNLTIYISTVSRFVSLFDIIIYLAALVCKKYGYEGNISSKLPSIAKILGFNFKEDLINIRNDISNNQYLQDDTELLNLLTNMDMSSLSSVNQTIEKIFNLRTLISNRKINAKSRNEFFAYSNLEKTMMLSDIIEDVYEKSDGDTALSFADLLNDRVNYLYERLNSVDLNINNEIDTVLETLTRTFSSAKYINYTDINNINATITQLFKLLYFFKSAKSELIGYNIIYTFSLRGINMMKLMDQLTNVSQTVFLNTDINDMDDIINKNSFMNNLTSENMSLSDYGMLEFNHKHFEDLEIPLMDKINLITQNFSTLELKNDDILTDDSKYYESNNFTKSNAPFSDRLTLIHETLVP